ncbi:hypothetical protein LCGC14_2805170, partial [marine sediment metagenome]
MSRNAPFERAIQETRSGKDTRLMLFPHSNGEDTNVIELVANGDPNKRYIRAGDYREAELKLPAGLRIGRKMVFNDEDVFEIITESSGGSFNSIVKAPKPFRPPKDRKEAIDIGYRLFKWDPLGGLICKVTTFFVFGKGMQIVAPDMSEKVINKFWIKNNL